MNRILRAVRARKLIFASRTIDDAVADAQRVSLPFQLAQTVGGRRTTARAHIGHLGKLVAVEEGQELLRNSTETRVFEGLTVVAANLIRFHVDLIRLCGVRELAAGLKQRAEKIVAVKKALGIDNLESYRLKWC